MSSPIPRGVTVPHIENLHEEVAPNTTNSDPTPIDPRSLRPTRVQFQNREVVPTGGTTPPIPPPAKVFPKTLHPRATETSKSFPVSPDSFLKPIAEPKVTSNRKTRFRVKQSPRG